MSVHAVVKILVANLRIVFLLWCRMVDLTKQLWILTIALTASSNSYEYTGETMWWSWSCALHSHGSKQLIKRSWVGVRLSNKEFMIGWESFFQEKPIPLIIAIFVAFETSFITFSVIGILKMEYPNSISMIGCVWLT